MSLVSSLGLTWGRERLTSPDMVLPAIIHLILVFTVGLAAMVPSGTVELFSLDADVAKVYFEESSVEEPSEEKFSDGTDSGWALPSCLATSFDDPVSVPLDQIACQQRIEQCDPAYPARGPPASL